MKAVIEKWLTDVVGLSPDDFLFDEVDDLVADLRAWAKENADVPELAGYLARGNRIKAECSCGECEPVWTGDLRSAVPLDKFGGDE